MDAIAAIIYLFFLRIPYQKCIAVEINSKTQII